MSAPALKTSSTPSSEESLDDAQSGPSGMSSPLSATAAGQVVPETQPFACSEEIIKPALPAVAAVFELPELLETILGFVGEHPRCTTVKQGKWARDDHGVEYDGPAEQLFVLQRVNTFFRAIVAESPMLQRRMFLAPYPAGTPCIRADTPLLWLQARWKAHNYWPPGFDKLHTDFQGWPRNTEGEDGWMVPERLPFAVPMLNATVRDNKTYCYEDEQDDAINEMWSIDAWEYCKTFDFSEDDPLWTRKMASWRKMHLYCTLDFVPGRILSELGRHKFTWDAKGATLGRPKDFYEQLVQPEIAWRRFGEYDCDIVPMAHAVNEICSSMRLGT